MYSSEKNPGINWKDLIVKVIFFVIFILILMWLFPKVPNMTAFYSNVFRENISYMQDAAKSYYTNERLPKNVGDMANIQDTVLELSDTASKKIIAYFSESQLALIDKDTNFIIVNQAQDHFEAKISYISNTAIFTPKNVITNELRGFLVYEVHLLLTTANNNLRDGQSVSVYFDE